MTAANLDHDKKAPPKDDDKENAIENQVLAVIMQAKQHKNKEAYE